MSGEGGPRDLYLARAWRRQHAGPYFVSVEGVADDVEWDGEPTDEHVRSWIAARLQRPRDSFDVQFSFEPGDVPPASMSPD